MILYADTSALVRAYFPDEPGHAELRELLLEGSETVVSSELSRVELARAIVAAARAGRLSRPGEHLALIDRDCCPGGPIELVALQARTVLSAAYGIVLQHRLRTLDAIHVAVALGEAARSGAALSFVTRDVDQAEAARALGLDVC